MSYIQKFDHVDILYQNHNILVVDKPSGMLVHPAGKPGQDNLVEFFQKQLNDPEIRPVHRLDRLTSGLVILAKNIETARFYGRVFSSANLEKVYLAQLNGPLLKDEGVLDNFLADDDTSVVKIKRKVAQEGQNAYTRFETIKTDAKHSYVKLFPKTGRRHQLRVHMAHLGCPIVGDPIYDLGDDFYLSLINSTEPSPPMHLHAWQITTPVPGQEKNMTFESPYPSFWKI
ncbi:MAG TPA: RluA family pseudouridine synthase [Oligoflexia bacterium]|nr:RluA family pseudouridine synthase [Oligoflexia bacterium]HMR24764.1 RluA family pseudouridine synthase [Oligoflexia bacterium]